MRGETSCIAGPGRKNRAGTLAWRRASGPLDPLLTGGGAIGAGLADDRGRLLDDLRHGPPASCPSRWTRWTGAAPARLDGRGGAGGAREDEIQRAWAAGDAALIVAFALISALYALVESIRPTPAATLHVLTLAWSAHRR